MSKCLFVISFLFVIITGNPVVLGSSFGTAHEIYNNVPNKTKVIVFAKGATLINPSKESMKDTKGVITTAGVMRKLFLSKGISLSINTDEEVIKQQSRNYQILKVQSQFVKNHKDVKKVVTNSSHHFSIWGYIKHFLWKD